MPIRVPRWLGPLVWPVQLGALHGALPVELSRHGMRHGWRSQASRPGAANMAGLVPIGAGAALIGWALAAHYVSAPGKSWKIDANLEPEYLLTEGAYRVSRNPMHVGGIAIWTGWTIWFGSAPVAAGLGILTGLYRAGIAWEERMLERRWGDDWNAYADRTGRWLSRGNPPNRPSGVLRRSADRGLELDLASPGIRGDQRE